MPVIRPAPAMEAGAALPCCVLPPLPASCCSTPRPTWPYSQSQTQVQQRIITMTSILGALVPEKHQAPAAATTTRKDESRRMAAAVQWMGARSVAVGEVPVPVVTEPKVPASCRSVSPRGTPSYA
ncbi:hypothetical protein ABPG75_012992 [Micractinium tetrahymenae]